MLKWIFNKKNEGQYSGEPDADTLYIVPVELKPGLEAYQGVRKPPSLVGDLIWWTPPNERSRQLYASLHDWIAHRQIDTDIGRLSADIVDSSSISISRDNMRHFVERWRGVFLSSTASDGWMEKKSAVQGYEIVGHPLDTRPVLTTSKAVTPSLHVYPIKGYEHPPIGDVTRQLSDGEHRVADNQSAVDRIREVREMLEAWLEEQPENVLLQSVGAATLTALALLQQNVERQGSIETRQALLAQIKELASRLLDLSDQGTRFVGAYRLLRLLLSAFGIDMPDVG